MSLKFFKFKSKGAQTPIYLSLLPKEFEGLKGAFWAEMKVEDWKTLPLNL